MAVADTLDSEKRQKGFAVFSTPNFMAPEQVAGEPVDVRCDIYALGCVSTSCHQHAPVSRVRPSS